MLNRRDLLASGVGLALAGGSAAGAQSMDEAAATNAFFRDGLYLPLFAQAKAKGVDPHDSAGQTLAMYYAMLGQEADAFRAYKPFDAPLDRGAAEAWSARLRQASAEDALDAIAKAAKGRRVVILNEAHHVSRCRAFAVQAARRLRREGFTHFAAETFSVNPPSAPGAAVDLSVVTPTTGYYTRDPVFAALLREVRDGWSGALAYEAPFNQQLVGDPQAQIQDREEKEAAALADILARDPRMRLFVYCGYGHLAKVPQGAIPWMAARLWQKTGIEPLCISQAYGAPAPDPRFSWSGVEEVLAAFRPATSIVLKDRDGAPLAARRARPGSYDLAVYHPRAPDQGARPGWLAALPGRNRVRAPVPEGTGMKLIQAVPSAEQTKSANAIAADQVLIEDGRPSVDLWLPAGRYDLRVETLAGRTVLNSITV